MKVKSGKFRHLLSSVTALVLGLGIANPVSAYSYKVYVVSQSAYRSIGGAVNAIGQVAGYDMASRYGQFQSYLYDPSGYKAPVASVYPGLSYATATGINDLGQVAVTAVAGYPSDPCWLSGAVCQQAFIYQKGIATKIPTLGGSSNTAKSVNNQGQVTGWSNISGNNGVHAYVYGNGKITDIGTLGGSYSGGCSINDNGQVTGNSTLPGNNTYSPFNVVNSGSPRLHAFLYGGGRMQDLGTLGGLNSEGMNINNNGQVIGKSNIASGQIHAFIYSNGMMTDLGALTGPSSVGNDINNLGDAVGSYMKPVALGYSQHAFVYDNSSMADLNDLIDPNSGWLLSNATGINDAGWITGEGKYRNIASTFLAVPCPNLAC